MHPSLKARKFPEFPLTSFAQPAKMLHLEGVLLLSPPQHASLLLQEFKKNASWEEHIAKDSAYVSLNTSQLSPDAIFSPFSLKG